MCNGEEVVDDAPELEVGYSQTGRMVAPVEAVVARVTSGGRRAIGDGGCGAGSVGLTSRSGSRDELVEASVSEPDASVRLLWC